MNRPYPTPLLWEPNDGAEQRDQIAAGVDVRRHPAGVGGGSDPRQRDQGVPLAASSRAASSRSPGRLALKNGSTGSSENGTTASRNRAVQTSTLRTPSSTRAPRSASRSRTGQSTITGWAWPPEAAQARSAPSAVMACAIRDTRSAGRNGASVGTLTISGQSARFAAVQSSPASTPASGPAKSGTLSATTGSP